MDYTSDTALEQKKMELIKEEEKIKEIIAKDKIVSK